MLDVAQGFLQTAPEDRSGEDRTLVVAHVGAARLVTDSAERAARNGDIPAETRAGTHVPAETRAENRRSRGTVRRRRRSRGGVCGRGDPIRPVTSQAWAGSSRRPPAGGR